MTELSKTDRDSNIALVKKLAKECFLNNPILAQLTAAQAILESGLAHAPPSQLALEYNNLFGIKGIGTGKIIDGKLQTRALLQTKEYHPGSGWSTPHQGFAINASIEDSLIQHRELFKNGTQDNPNRYKNLFVARTFEEAALDIAKDGYCTDPHYSSKLVSVYTEYGLGEIE